MVKFNEIKKVWEGPRLTYPYPADTFLGEVILEKLKETPDRVLQINYDTKYELKCGELRISSIRVAQNLTQLGIKADDVVCVAGKHCKEVSILLTACFLIGAPVAPLDLPIIVESVKRFFRLALPKLIVCELEVLEKVKEVLAVLKIDAKVIVLDHEGVFNTFNDLLIPTGTENDFVAPKFDKPADEKILAICGTSGTTGPSKSLPMSHARFLNGISNYSHPKNHDGKPGFSLSFSPLSWAANGLPPHIYLAFSPTDVRVITRETFSVEKLTEIMARYKITSLTVPPVALNLILQSDFPKMVDHSSLKKIFTLGSIITETSRIKFEETFPEKDLVISYGTNELWFVATTSPGEYKTAFTVGSTLYPGIILKIVDDEQRRLGVGEVGEICVTPATKFHDYAFSSVDTKGELDDENFFHTGDIGYIDEKGFLFIVGRNKDNIVVSGHRVRTSEIESFIESIDGVEAVSVVGIPDEVCVNLLAAVVVKREGFDELNEQLIKGFAASKLEFFRQLNGGIFFEDKLPLTASGKVSKYQVAEFVKQQSSLGRSI